MSVMNSVFSTMLHPFYIQVFKINFTFLHLIPNNWVNFLHNKMWFQICCWNRRCHQSTSLKSKVIFNNLRTPFSLVSLVSLESNSLVSHTSKSWDMLKQHYVCPQLLTLSWEGRNYASAYKYCRYIKRDFLEREKNLREVFHHSFFA